MTQPLDPATIAKRRRVAFAILFVLALVICGAGLRDDIKAHGVSVGVFVPAVFSLVLLAAIVGGVLRWTAKAEAQPGGATPEAARRRRNIFIAVGVAGASLSGLATVLQTVTAPRPAAPAFHLDGGRVSSIPLGLALTLAAPWEPAAVPAQPGVDFAVQHPPSGTVLTGYGLVLEPGDTDDEATLRTVLEGRRQKWGAIFDAQWGEELVGGLRAKTVAMTIQRPDGRVRTKLWLAHKGPYGVGFNCAGPEPTFADGDQQCRALLDRIEAR